MRAPRVLRHVTSLALAAGLVVGGAQPAAAQDMTLGVVGWASIEVLYAYDGSAFMICVRGRIPEPARLTGTWTMRINGTRSNGDPVTDAWGSEDAHPHYCVVIEKNGAPSGSFNVEWQYVAVGTYVYAGSNGVVAWDPHIGDTYVVAPTS